MSKLQLDLSGRMGLTSNYFGDSDQTMATNNRNFGSGQSKMVDGYFNPFLRVGFLSPSVATLNSTTVSGATQNANIGSREYDVNNDDLYLAERGQQLFHFDGLDDTSLVQDFDLGATGTPVIHDLEIYQINGVRKLFYVYTKAGNFNVGIESLPTGTNDPVWLTTTTAGAFTNGTVSPYNFMRSSDNGFAYLFQDNNVHKIDGTLATGGTNGTVTPNALTFPAYFRITDAVDYRGFVFMVVHQSTVDVTTIQTTGNTFASPVGIYVWDRETLTSSNNDFIPVNGVLSVQKIFIAPNGNLRLICVGANKLPQIREFDGHAFPIVKELSLGAAPQYPDSFTTAGNISIWLGMDGTIYGYGFPLNSESATEVLAKIGRVVTTNTTHPEFSIFTGAVHYGASNTFSSSTGYREDRQGLTICYNDSGTGVGTNNVKKFYPFDKGTINSSSQFSLQGDIYTPVTPLPTLCTVNTITIFMATGSSSGSTPQGTVKIYFNGSSAPWAVKTITRDDVAKGYFNIKVGKPYINTVQLEIEYPTATIMSDATDFHPFYADVDYTATTVLQAA